MRKTQEELRRGSVEQDRAAGHYQGNEVQIF